MNCLINLNQELTELGELYEKLGTDKWNEIEFTKTQSGAIILHNAGYEIGEQIHDCYAEIGAILEGV